jgi:hypothetical protein
MTRELSLTIGSAFPPNHASVASASRHPAAGGAPHCGRCHGNDFAGQSCVQRTKAIGLATAIVAALTVEQARAAPPAASLVAARLAAVADISGEPGAPCFCDEQGRLILDGSWRLTFSVTRWIAGPQVSGPLVVKEASPRPAAGRDYLLVVTHDGGLAVAWRGLAREGLCLEPEDAERYGLSDAVRAFPCKSRRVN